MKKLAALIALVAALTMLTMAAYAAEEWSYRLDGDGFAHITGYSGSDSTVQLPNALGGHEVIGIDSNAFSKGVSRAIVPITISEIESDAFPSNVVIQARHGAYALRYAYTNNYDWKDLSEIPLGDFVIDLTEADITKLSSSQYSLSPATVKATEGFMGFYLQGALSVGTAYKPISSRKENGQIIVTVSELEAIYTYDKIEIEYNTSSRRSRSATKTVHNGIVRIECSADETGELRLGLPFEHLYDVRTWKYHDIKFRIGLNAGEFVRALFIKPHIEFDTSEFLLPSIMYMVLEYDVDFEHRTFFGETVGLDPYQVDTALDGTISVETPTKKIPLGDSGFFLKIKASGEINYSTYHENVMGDRNHHYGFEYDGTEWRNLCEDGEHYSSGTVGDEWGAEVAIHGIVNFATLVDIVDLTGSYECGMQWKTVHKTNYPETVSCRDYTWTSHLSADLFVGLQIEWSKVTSWFANTDFGGSFDIDLFVVDITGYLTGSGVGFGGSFHLWESNKGLPWYIGDIKLENGDTAHFEYEVGGIIASFETGSHGEWVYYPECTHGHSIRFESGIPNDEPIIRYCRSTDSAAVISALKPENPVWGEKKFLGWFEANKSMDFFSQINSGRNIDWDGELKLEAHWSGSLYTESSQAESKVQDKPGLYNNKFYMTGEEGGTEVFDIVRAGLYADPQAFADEWRQANEDAWSWKGKWVKTNQDLPLVAVHTTYSDLSSVTLGNRIIGTDGYAGSTHLTSISLHEGMVYIGTYQYCYKLESLSIPNSVRTLNSDLCADCHSLKSVSLPQSYPEIPDRSFYNCVSLQSISIPAAVTDIGTSAFENSGLRSITIPSGCNVGQYAFKGCKELTSVIGRARTYGSWAFAHTTSLRSVILTGDTITLSPGIFYKSGVESVTIDCDTLIMDGIWAGLNGLEQLTIKCNTCKGSISIGNCPKLREIHLNVGKVTGNVTIDDNIAVRDITLNASSIERLQLSDCQQIETFTFNGNVSTLAVTDCFSLKEIHGGNVSTGMNISENYNLTYVHMGSGTQYANIGVGCPHLERVEVPGSAETPGADRRYVRVYESLDDGSQMHTLSFESAFGTEHEPIQLAAGNTYELFWPVRYGMDFSGWYLDEALTEPIDDPDNFTMPDEDTTLYIRWSGTHSGVYDTFALLLSEACTELNANALRNNMTSVVYLPATMTDIAPGAFRWARALEQIIVDPQNPVYYAEDGILYKRDGTLICVPCASDIRELKLSDDITGIAAYAFANSGLSAVYIPDSVNQIDDVAFNGLSYCKVYGPTEGVVAEAAIAADLNYNQFVAAYYSNGEPFGIWIGSTGETVYQPVPIIAGKTFIGWSTEEGGTPISANFTMPYGGTVLHAIWKTNSDYDGHIPVLSALNKVPRGNTLNVNVYTEEQVDSISLTVYDDLNQVCMSYENTADDLVLRFSCPTNNLSLGRYRVEAVSRLGDKTWTSSGDYWIELIGDPEAITLKLDGYSIPLGGDLPFTVSAPGAEQVRVIAELPDGTWDGEWTFDGESGEGTVWWWSLSDHIVYAQAMFDGEWSEPGRMFTVATECYGALTQPSMDFPAIAWAGADIDFTLYADQVDSCWYTLEVVDAQSGEWIMQGDYGEAGANTLNTVRDDARLEAGHVYNLYLTQWAVGYEAGASEEYIVAVIDPGKVFTLPKKLKTIEEEAFTGINAQLIVVPDGVTQIGARAFADSPNLIAAVLPDSLQNVDSSVFEGCGNPFVIGNQVP